MTSKTFCVNIFRHKEVELCSHPAASSQARSIILCWHNYVNIVFGCAKRVVCFAFLFAKNQKTLIWRCPLIATKASSSINEEIRASEVRVIGADGKQLGVMKIQEALNLANEAELDLVEIAPDSQPPVCKIMDYGKYRFEQQKKEKENKKNQKVVETKEVRLSINIDTNDFNTKVNQANKFLKNGDKVKVSIRFRGREMAHSKLGLDVMERFGQAIEGGTIEKAAKLEGRNMLMFIAPAHNK